MIANISKNTAVMRWEGRKVTQGEYALPVSIVISAFLRYQRQAHLGPFEP